MNRFIYRLTNRKNNSAKYGNCEVCNQWVDSIYLLVELQVYFDEKGEERLTTYNCNNYHGHKKCLVDQQR